MTVYFCPYCRMQFTLLQELKGHLRKEHNQKKGQEINVEILIWI